MWLAKMPHWGIYFVLKIFRHQTDISLSKINSKKTWYFLMGLAIIPHWSEFVVKRHGMVVFLNEVG